MKRFLLIFVFIVFILTSSVQAKTIKVISLQNFSTKFPLETYNVEILERVNLGRGIILEPGTIIAGRVVRIEKPKRGKRNAYFEFIPMIISYKGVTKTINHPDIIAQINGYRHINPEQAAIYVAKKATNFIFIGASLGVSFVQGAMEAEEGDTLRSGLMQTYKDTPLSFIDVGSELNVDMGDVLKFKIKKIR